MKRRHFIAGTLAVGSLAAFMVKPKDSGSGYDDYFARLNDELKSNGPYKPSVLVDLDRLDKNIEQLKKTINPDVSYRIVAKSLPSPELLSYVMEKANTRRLMVFHQPFLSHVAVAFPDADVLMGKPMPVKAAERFYQQLPEVAAFDPTAQLQWLIDSPERLHQYLELAKAINTSMRINIEIDVGLHRGGVDSLDVFEQMLAIIESHPEHLSFAGLMGYDPHVVKLPSIIKSKEQAYQESQTIYSSFIDYVREKLPHIKIESLCLNGAGSPTLAMHQQGSVINDIAAGSCLVKPSDFDIPSLSAFTPAAYIATPVLKKLKSTQIPAVEALSNVFEWWDPNQQQTFFIYGGEWMAHYESPQGLQGNALFGKSTNQQMINGSHRVELKADDHVFLRPTQSEAVFLQFGELIAMRGEKIEGHWSILKEA
ncbi:DSD1 family PLP-dependent enzyme [Pleionea sp. CnH1-48]|uniref:DSD1 family PLP-dependent enzyme n=1 Tax=Pleionea sp. CnH1-48 TaxID=2954494 RepID=UPI0020984E40|nr:DSD1 family PLP-dependent enzyme [Pleionea sp. CnH1-48]MCO7227498.1 DSD1 family PLP-dependent enzyme [Pleionea sp. CnH1-48]